MNSIQLHELLVRMKENTFVRINQVQDGKMIEILNGEIKDIADLMGYHHNNVESISLNMANIITILIE